MEVSMSSVIRRSAASVGSIGGFALAAVFIGMGPAHADDLPAPIIDFSADATPVNTDPLGILGEAGSKITEANQVLNDVPAIGTAAETALVNQQLDVQFQLGGLPLNGPDGADVGGQLASLQSAEAAILSYDGGALDSYVGSDFLLLDTNWLSASEALLAADQALETAAADGASPLAAEFAIYGADLSLFSDAASSISIDWASSLF
jgi:hypothetical protein